VPQDQQQERYNYIAHQINREDNLVNHRLTWTLQLNGFLFTALALISDKVDPSTKAFFLYALPATGLIVSLAGLMGVLAANHQLNYLTQEWDPKTKVLWPRPFGAPLARWLGKFPSLAPVIVLSIVWLWLLLHNIRYSVGRG
jgi:hypothetical protein